MTFAMVFATPALPLSRKVHNCTRTSLLKAAAASPDGEITAVIENMLWGSVNFSKYISSNLTLPLSLSLPFPLSFSPSSHRVSLYNPGWLYSGTHYIDQDLLRGPPASSFQVLGLRLVPACLAPIHIFQYNSIHPWDPLLSLFLVEGMFSSVATLCLSLFSCKVRMIILKLQSYSEGESVT